jgi:NADH-quinone oxidoreductase subunit M
VLSAYSPLQWNGGGLNVDVFRTFMVVAAIGTVLAAGYLLWMYQRVAFGEPKAEFADLHVHDVNVFEWIAWTPLLVFIVVLGVYPDLLFDLTNDRVTLTVRHIAQAIGG